MSLRRAALALCALCLYAAACFAQELELEDAFPGAVLKSPGSSIGAASYQAPRCSMAKASAQR